jgi:hypothetical protein
MKKLSIIALATMLFMQAGTTFAQDGSHTTSINVDSKAFRFGVFVAPTMSWMRPTTDKTDDGTYGPTNDGSKIGFTYGLMAEYHFAENYAFVTGLQVNMAGGNINSKFLGSPTTPSTVINSNFNYRLQYLEIPVALKLRTDLISGFRFFGQLGLTTGFNIAKKATYNVDYTDGNGKMLNSKGENEKIKGTLAIAPMMFTMSIGGGAEYPLNDKLAAYVGIFFNNGFAPDATNPNKYDMPYNLKFQDANTRLNNFALRLGLFF